MEYYADIYKKTAKVGDHIQITKLHDSDDKVSDELIGIVGEINGNNFYLWHNNPNHEGSMGAKHPKSQGFEYSWCVDFKADRNLRLTLIQTSLGTTFKCLSCGTYCPIYFESKTKNNYCIRCTGEFEKEELKHIERIESKTTKSKPTKLKERKTKPELKYPHPSYYSASIRPGSVTPVEPIDFN